MDKKTAPASIDDYLGSLPADTAAVLEKLRQTIRKAAPAAEECISYQMPTFKYHGLLVHFAAFKNHCSFFPGSAKIVASLQDELKKYKTAKGTIQFTLHNPLPATLVTKIVKARMRENEERKGMKK
jgi:uncharacterized protein YdhG (YjbR/CyaY superfamily)